MEDRAVERAGMAFMLLAIWLALVLREPEQLVVAFIVFLVGMGAYIMG